MNNNLENKSKLVGLIHSSLGCTEKQTFDFIKIALEDIILFDNKQRDYGPDNIAEFGEFGVLVRANDKLARLKNLLKLNSDIRPSNESIQDTWTDLSVYGIIARLVRTGLWRSRK